MKVLHIVTGLDAGDAERQLRLLLRRLPLHCEVVTLTAPGPAADALRADGTPVTHLAMSGSRDLTTVPRLARLIRRGGHDLVHTHGYRACVYGRIAARLAGVRHMVATEQALGEEVVEDLRLTRGVRALYLGTERLGSATVAVSEAVAGRLRRLGVPDQRITVVPCGIDADHYRYDPAARNAARARLRLPADAFVVGCADRLLPGKGLDLLVRAVAQLPGTRLLLTGDGPEHPALLRLADQFGAGDRIHLLGAACATVAPTGTAPAPEDTGAETSEGTPADAGAEAPADAGADRRPERPALLAALDVFVAPAPEEAFGLAAVEALASGLPVLHVACPALDELSTGEAPGVRRVSPDAYAMATALREERRRAPRRLPVPPAVERYGIDRTAEALMALYERVRGTAPATAEVPQPAQSPSDRQPAPQAQQPPSGRQSGTSLSKR